MAPVYPPANARLKSLTSIDKAFARIASLAEPIQGDETVALAASLGRVHLESLQRRVMVQKSMRRRAEMARPIQSRPL
jgi:molybdopterin biosynthesis enzyme